MYLRLLFIVHFVSLFGELLTQDYDDMAIPCNYSTDMSLVDPENCIRKLRAFAQTSSTFRNGRIEHCQANLYYGSGMLYKGRHEVAHFSVELGESSAGYIAEDFSYTILRGTGDWTVENSLTPIPGCERMGEEDVCTLPMRVAGERQYAFFPLNRSRNNSWFCQFELKESINPSLQTWCDLEDEVGCIYIGEDGKLKQRGEFIPLNMEDVFDTYDYCIFPMDKDYFGDDDRVEFGVGNIDLHDDKEGNSANVSGEMIDCTLRNNLTLPPGKLGDVLEEHEPKEEYTCYFFRIPGNEWFADPRCQKRSEAEVLKTKRFLQLSASVVVPLVIVVVASAVVLGMIITMMWLYKTRLKSCTFKKNIEELPRPLAERQPSVDHGSPEKLNNNNGRKEIVDEITFSPLHDEGSDTSKSGLVKADYGIDKMETSGTNKGDANSINVSDDIAEVTPLCEGTDSGFHSMPNEGKSTKLSVAESVISDDPSRTETTTDSGLASLESNSGFTQKTLPIMDGYTDKNSFKEPGGKASFPSYVKKNFLEQGSAAGGNMPLPTTTGYTAKDEIV